MAVSEEIKVSIIGDASSMEAASKKAERSLQNIKKGTVNASYAVTNLNRIVQDAPYGFIGIANNLNPALESLQQLSKQAKESGQSITSVLLKSLTGPAGLGLALAGITSAITFAQVGLSMWIRSSKDAGKATSDLKRHTEEASITMREMSKGLSENAAKIAGGDVAQMQKFLAVLSDIQIPLQQRNKALEHYNEIADKQNKLSSTDLDNIGKINTAIERQIKLFETRALVKAAEDQIAEAFKKVFEVKYKISTAKPTVNKGPVTIGEQGSEYEKFTKTVTDANTAVQKLGEQGFTTIKDFATDLSIKDIGIVKRIFGDKGGEQVIKDLGNAKASIRDLFAFIQQQVKDGSAFGDVLGDKTNKDAQRLQINFFDHFFDASPKTASDKAKQAVEMYKVAIEYAIKYQDSIVGLDELIKPNDKGKTMEKAKKIWADIQAGIVKFKPPVINVEQEMKITPKVDTSAIDARRDLFLYKTPSANNQGEGKMDLPFGINPEQALDDLKTQLQRIGAKLPSAIEATNVFGQRVIIPFDQVFDTSKIDAKAAVEAIKNAGKQMEAAAFKVQTDINNAFKSFEFNGFEGVAQGIGKSIAEGGNIMDGAFSSFFGVFGDFVEQIGKALLEYGIAKSGIDLVLKNPMIPGGVAIGLGATAIAAGELIKSLKPAHLATGGIIPPGFNNDTFPAMLSSGERVVPKGDWDKLIQSGGFGSQTVVVMGRLRGRDLILQQARESKTQRRGG